MGGLRSLPERRVISGLGEKPVTQRMEAGLERSQTTQPGQGKPQVHLGKMGSLVAEPYHMLVAGVRLGAGVATAVRIPIAILHCGVHTGSPQPPSLDALSPRVPHPALCRRPSLTPLQFLTLPVTAVACGKSCVHPQGRSSVGFRHGGCAA